MSNKFSGTFEYDGRDELFGGTLRPTETYNLKVNASAELKRGDLMAAINYQSEFAKAAATDVEKVFAVIREDFTASSDCTVTAGYISGTFNRQKLRVASSDTATVLTTLEPALRRQNILLTELRPNHQPAF